jgi:prepilin-type N-terminal cleavage/methylation domain-containing protein
MIRLTARLRRARDEAHADAGFTLIEMLVSMLLLGVLGIVFMDTIMGSKSSLTATATSQDLNEEARLALNRMARELRQATAITKVLNPDGASYSASAITAVTFTADFNGDGCIDGVAPTPTPTPPPVCQPYSASNPETLTYCWDPSGSSKQLYLIPGTLSGATCQVSGAMPILAGQVTTLKLAYRSNLYLYDANGDGITTWTELDQAGPPVGNQNGVLDQPEMANIDSVVIDMTVASTGGFSQSYETQVDLRNLS